MTQNESESTCEKMAKSRWTATILATLAIASAIFYPSWLALPLLALLFISLLVNRQLLKSMRASETSDVSYQKTLREHRLLLESFHAYPMPFAIYDENDYLSVWNKQYEGIYLKLFSSLKNRSDAKLLTYADMVRSNAEEHTSGAELEAFIKKRVASQRDTRTQISDRLYSDLGWYRVLKYSIPSGGIAGIAIDINESKRREAELIKEVELRQALEIKMRRIADTDDLTGIANRRCFLEKAERIHSRCCLSGSLFSFLMIDIDHFKSINDAYGHPVGDSILKIVADAIFTTLTSDSYVVGRLGGEEFAAILPETSVADGEAVAENIRTAVEECIYLHDRKALKVSVSIGLAHHYAADATLLELIKQADDALYQAKRDGRNRVKVSGNLILKRTGTG